MPELPHVEVIRRYLDATSLHQPVRDVEVRERSLLEGVSGETLSSRLRGRELASSVRHGKYLLAETTGPDWIYLHFGMSGFLQYFRKPESEPPYAYVLLDFENGYHLAFDCRRKLGRVGLTEGPEALAREKELGPDVMRPEFDADAFVEILSGRRGMVKTALMNQSAMAGVGNEYSDEILFQAGLHPRTRVADLGKDRLEELYATLRETLETAVACRADPEQLPESYLLPHREPGAGCPRCGGEIRRVEISGRGAYYCPSCQRKR